MASFSLWPVDAVNPEEQSFFRQLGTRIAQLRKHQGLTQQQLADALQVTQQVVASYEIGRRRIPVSMLPTLARALAVSVEDLIGERHTVARKRGPAPRLAQHMERISQLPRAKQRFVIEMLDTVLAQAGR